MGGFSLLELVSGMEDSVHSAKLLTQDTGFDTELFTIAELTVKDLSREIDGYLGFLSIYEKLDSNDSGTPESLSYTRGKVEAFFQCNGIEVNLDEYSSEAVKDTVKKIIDNLKKVIASLSKKFSNIFSAIKKAFLNFMGWGEESTKKNKEKVEKAKDVEKSATSEQRKAIEYKRKDTAKVASRVNKEKIKVEMEEMENSTSDLMLIVPDFLSESGEFNLSKAFAVKEQIKKLSELPIADIANTALESARNDGMEVHDIITEFFETKLGNPNSKTGYKLTYDFSFGSINIDIHNGALKFVPSDGKSPIANMSTDDCDALNNISAELSRGIAKILDETIRKAEFGESRIFGEAGLLSYGESTEETRALAQRIFKSARVVAKVVSTYARNVAGIVEYVYKAQFLAVSNSIEIETKQLEKAMNKG